MHCSRAVTLEQPATVDLALIFEYLGIRVTSYEETSLTANQVRCLHLICICVCGVVRDASCSCAAKWSSVARLGPQPRRYL